MVLTRGKNVEDRKKRKKLEGRSEGRRSRERPRKVYIKGIEEMARENVTRLSH